MIIIGIDPGTAKMGICKILGTIKSPQFVCSMRTSIKTDHIDKKFKEMVGSALFEIDNDGIMPDLVVCEYPFSIQGHAKILVEMFGAIRYHCLLNNIPFLALSQSRIKKYATGVGKDVEKSAMVMRAFKEYGLDLSDDKADAFWIAHIGMLYTYPELLKKAPQFRQDSIYSIKNPKKKIRKKKREDADGNL